MTDYMVVKTTEVKVKEGLPRLRKDMKKIKELSKSFKKFGQMQPCLVNRDMELIAGGRRLAACIMNEIDVRIVFSDAVDPILMREMELEENLQREALSVAEEIQGISELHKLKQTIYGDKSIKNPDGWTQEKTAELAGKTRTSVTGDLALAEALENFPILANCKTKSEIKKAVKGLQRISASVTAVTEYDENMKKNEDKFTLLNVDSIEHMKTLPAKSISVLFTDPPYGIDVHDTMINIGGHTGSEITSTGTKYDDAFDQAMEKIAVLATESSRFVKDDGFAVVFCAISHFWIVKALFDGAGWNCSQRPIIWIKNESGQNNAPTKWMSAGYEAMLFARKIDSQLTVEGKVDWIQCQNVVPSARIHHAEKPVPLFKELLSRLTMPGDSVYDPFVGSGTSIESCLDLRLHIIACEDSFETYALAKQRVVQYFKQKGD